MSTVVFSHAYCGVFCFDRGLAALLASSLALLLLLVPATGPGISPRSWAACHVKCDTTIDLQVRFVLQPASVGSVG